MSKVPEAGAILSMEDLDMVFEAVRERQEKFPDEPAAMSFYTVINGIGERFRTIQCHEQEWETLKKDIPEGEGALKCPNGHDLFAGPGIAIGWVTVE
jgi:hypothetical protein